MGSGAYDFLADNAAHHRHVLAELAGSFAWMLELVARSCRHYRKYSASEIMALYQRWLTSGDPAEAEILQQQAISLEQNPRRHQRCRCVNRYNRCTPSSATPIG
ncbi:hypothetical protein [Marinobacterium rhizophilum]|uniref:Uncharacterized protein n=1 Tax=Marinobacterium rhizophilum TaxID=420402 RepID=A0ABY5HN68_9GAMM|nr:hypothetical protein [Marinobacterium rhizophilum]UTW12692.1 hypothetical protein KDW95_03150 [Marinobacterium rhizophilum]